MKKNRILIITIFALCVLVLLYLLGSYTNKKRYDWREDYSFEHPRPYGITIIYELLKGDGKTRKCELINQKLCDKFRDKKYSTPSNYVFIGNDFVIDSIDTKALLDYVSEGNDAFIASKSVSQMLIDSLYDGLCREWDGYYDHPGKMITMNFYDSSLYSEKGFKFFRKHENDSIEYNWNVIDGDYFCDSSFTFYQLGYIDSFYVNYVSVDYGDGRFLFHTTPVAFANICMLREEGFEYANNVFSYINNGDIYFDGNRNKYSLHSPSAFSETPLKYILSQPSLRWAWYLLLLMVLLYFIFHAKRKQRIIPVLEANSNTSLEFVKIIGKLYLQQNDPQVICNHKMKLFLNFIRNRYYLSTNVIDEQLFQKISEKSDLQADVINKIFKTHKLINTLESIDSDLFIKFHQELEYFYKNCK